ncbi:MAG TPA: class I SAM-dependent methyltransferase, partial [Solirubrobacteraceae bacterium]|nr:class I SAM-dependent methyltransferase [Solirubrobacteraceae bacterium]
MDWQAWHEDYENRDSALGRRLVLVQAQVRTALDRAPPGPIRAVSICAGQGHDLIGALAQHPRRGDVTARLVELDEHNVGIARRAAHAAGLDGVEVVAADASVTDAYAGAVPADLILLCGVLGNITAADIANTIRHLPSLCAPAATVIWT